MSGSFGRRALRATGLLAIAAVIVFAALPAVAASAAYPTYITSDYSATRSFGISWNGAGIPAGSKFDVEYKDGTSGAWTRWRTATTATSGNFPGLYGHTYWFRYRYITPANVTSYWSRTISFAVPYDNGSLHFSSGWGYVTARGLAFNNTLRYTKRVGASMSYSFTGRRAVVIATKARGRSKMAVYLDGSAKPYRIVDTYYYTTKYRWKVFDYTFKTYGAHKIVIKNLGTSRRPRLDIDARGSRPTGHLAAERPRNLSACFQQGSDAHRDALRSRQCRPRPGASRIERTVHGRDDPVRVDLPHRCGVGSRLCGRHEDRLRPLLRRGG